MTSGRGAVLTPVITDLQRIYGDRLEAVVAYGWPEHGLVPSLVLVTSISIDDLHACAARTASWRRAGARTPLLLTPSEFSRSLDAFPIEYGAILDRHEVVFGRNPLEGLSVRQEDLRRACEVQVKSHLLHLREDFLEGGGRPSEIDHLVRESAPGFAALLKHLARLGDAPSAGTAHLIEYATRRMGLGTHLVGDLLALAEPDGMPAVDTVKLFPAYLAAMERMAEFVDRWRTGS